MFCYMFFKGLILSFAITAAIGPICILCIRRSLTNGFRSGFISGLGAALADAIYSAIGVFGVVCISSFLIKYQFLLQLIGALFLIYLGLKIFFTQISKIDSPTESSGKNLLIDFISTFFLTLTNPLTIIFFSIVFVGSGLTSSNYLSGLFLISGFILGSIIWWLILTFVTSSLGHKFNTKVLQIVNKVAGLIICSYGIVILVKLFLRF